VIGDSRFVGDRRFEESFAQYLSRYGPVIAVADPHQPPQRGAARTFLPDESWQQQVIAWMDKAALIVVLVGSTKGTKWELGQIISLNYLDKCVLVVPPTLDQKEQLAGAIEPFLGSRWESALQDLSACNGLRAFYCRSNGNVTAFWSRKREAADYLVALAFCIYGMLCHSRSEGKPTS